MSITNKLTQLYALIASLNPEELAELVKFIEEVREEGQ